MSDLVVSGAGASVTSACVVLSAATSDVLLAAAALDVLAR